MTKRIITHKLEHPVYGKRFLRELNRTLERGWLKPNEVWHTVHFGRKSKEDLLQSLTEKMSICRHQMSDIFERTTGVWNDTPWSMAQRSLDLARIRVSDVMEGIGRHPVTYSVFRNHIAEHHKYLASCPAATAFLLRERYRFSFQDEIHIAMDPIKPTVNPQLPSWIYVLRDHCQSGGPIGITTRWITDETIVNPEEEWVFVLNALSLEA